MSLKDLPHEKAGRGALLLALLVALAAITVIGVIVWLRATPSTVPTQPNQAVKPHSQLRVLPGRYMPAIRGQYGLGLD